MTALFSMKPADLVVSSTHSSSSAPNGRVQSSISLQNTAKVPAFFVRMELQDTSGADVNPAFFEDNYVTLWPGETLNIGVEWMAADAKSAVSVRMSGVNVGEVRDVQLKY